MGGCYRPIQFARPQVRGPRTTFHGSVVRSVPKDARNIAFNGGIRAMSSWRLRPYASAGVSGVVPLSSLSAGFNKVGLSLLVMPWKALPMALVIAPIVWALPAVYRMIFQNSMRHTTASAFTGLLYLVLGFCHFHALRICSLIWLSTSWP